MKNKKYWLLLLTFLCFALARLSAQCSVDIIDVPECQELNQYIVPVYVEYTGKADSIKLEMSGTQYEFPTQYFRGFNHYVGDSTNSFDYVFYHSLDGVPDNMKITVTLLGGRCIGEMHMKSFIYDSEDCLCVPSKILSGLLTSNDTYIVGDYITTNQEISTEVNVEYNVKNYLHIADNFQIAADATMDIILEGCETN
jgi:hypothetical protein